jgi:hypothetical protein
MDITRCRREIFSRWMQHEYHVSILVSHSSSSSSSSSSERDKENRKPRFVKML